MAWRRGWASAGPIRSCRTAQPQPGNPGALAAPPAAQRSAASTDPLLATAVADTDNGAAALPAAASPATPVSGPHSPALSVCAMYPPHTVGTGGRARRTPLRPTSLFPGGAAPARTPAARPRGPPSAFRRAGRFHGGDSTPGSWDGRRALDPGPSDPRRCARNTADGFFPLHHLLHGTASRPAHLSGVQRLRAAALPRPPSQPTFPALWRAPTLNALRPGSSAGAPPAPLGAPRGRRPRLVPGRGLAPQR